MSMEENQDIIFQVKINRKDNELEYVKRGLNDIEQLALERFLNIIIKTFEKERIVNLEKEYFENI